MAWQTIDISNPPGSEINTGRATVTDLSNSFQEFFANSLELDAPLQPRFFISASDPTPWPNAVPYIIKPVTGTMQVDCDASGCGTGGSGTERPTAGFLYPRRVE